MEKPMTINTKYLALLAAFLLLPASAFAQSIATFTVTKSWSNNAGSGKKVTVNIECTNGESESSGLLSQNQDVIFPVEGLDLAGGDHTCIITEDKVDGYSPYFEAGGPADEDDSGDGEESCVFYNINSANEYGGAYTCDITNYSKWAHVEVTKTWDVSGADQGYDDGYKVSLDCDNRVAVCDTYSNGKHYTKDPNGTPGWCKDVDQGLSSGKRSVKDQNGENLHIFVVEDPNTDEYCELKEKSADSVVESSFGDCGKGTKTFASVKKSGTTEISADLDLGPGETIECEIINTVFFEGIPTLSEYGMAILALLMLGVGFVGFRRFV
jgi:hypothetical protein